MKRIYKDCEIDIRKETFEEQTVWFGYIIDLKNGFDIEVIEEDSTLKWYEVLINVKDTVDRYRENSNKFVQNKLNNVKKTNEQIKIIERER